MSSVATRVHLHEDRLLPSAPEVRAIAREIHAAVRDLPVLSPHGHVDAALLLEDRPFRDATSLLVSKDHYVTRLLHAAGVPLDRLGVGRDDLDEAEARAAWRLLCEHWDVFRGTPVAYWTTYVLTEVFGLDRRPSRASADDLFDGVQAALARPEFRPRALFRRFGIELLATTDDPADDLAAHAALAADPAWDGRVVPTFRPDRYLEPAAPGWADAVAGLGAVADVDTRTWPGWVAAMERRREVFRAHGALSADHSHADVRAYPLGDEEAARVYRDAVAGTATPAAAAALRGHMLLEMARMSADDGLTMTLHTGVRRGHHPPTTRRFGPDTGHDVPAAAEFTDALAPLLERFGTDPGFTVVLFSLDEATYARDVAPLAGFYPSVYAGAPWWFYDAPDAIRRWRDAVTETAGFRKTAGFVDDTRAFCSIPARHDMSRRIDAGHLARLVAEHRLELDEAVDTAVDLVVGRPREVFGL
ncbi:glucuronate isomerase [Cellulomonas olei]|uniref:glucuronate isomerase n=1 Tax=Cellulomonas sp. P4 TaxID=3142533 RepID=UPI0031BACBEC